MRFTRKYSLAVLFGVFAALVMTGCGSGGGSSSHAAKCNDGTYSDSQSCSGTCSSHGGVAEFYNGCGGGSSSSGGGSSSGGDPAPTTSPATGVSGFAGTWSGPFVSQGTGGQQSGTTNLNIKTDGSFTGTSYNSQLNETATVNGSVAGISTGDATVKAGYVFPRSGAYTASGKIYITDAGHIFAHVEQYKNLSNGGLQDIGPATFDLTKL